MSIDLGVGWQVSNKSGPEHTIDLRVGWQMSNKSELERSIDLGGRWQVSNKSGSVRCIIYYSYDVLTALRGKLIIAG